MWNMFHKCRKVVQEAEEGRHRGSRPDHRDGTKLSPAPGTRNESVIPFAGGAQMTLVGSCTAIGWRHPSPKTPPEEAPAESRSGPLPTRSSPAGQAPIPRGRLASVGNYGVCSR